MKDYFDITTTTFIYLNFVKTNTSAYFYVYFLKMDAKQITYCFVLYIANNPVAVAMIPIKPTSIVTIYEAITEKDIRYFKRISLLLFYPF